MNRATSTWDVPYHRALVRPAEGHTATFILFPPHFPTQQCSDWCQRISFVILFLWAQSIPCSQCNVICFANPVISISLFVWLYFFFQILNQLSQNSLLNNSCFSATDLKCHLYHRINSYKFLNYFLYWLICLFMPVHTVLDYWTITTHFPSFTHHLPYSTNTYQAVLSSRCYLGLRVSTVEQ